MTPSRFRAVAFDAVGTLIHPDPPAAVVYFEAGRRFGSQLTLAEIATRFKIAFGYQEEIDRREGLRTSEERELLRWQHIVAAVLDDVANPQACFQALYDHFRLPAAWTCLPETGAILEQLHQRGYRLALASNYDDRLRTVAGGLPALRPVETLVISAEVGWRKPAPGFFASVCEQMKTPPSEVLFVGDDRGNDYDGARAAGLQALLFDPACRAPELGTTRIGSLSALLGLVALPG